MRRHAGLDAERWADFPLVDQMAHVGSEVERAIRAHARGDRPAFELALERAMELFDLTVTDARWTGRRRRELARAREEFRSLFHPPVDWDPSVERVREYYLQFAVAARGRRISAGGGGA